MSAVQVVFAVLKGTRRFIIEKGRRWSVIEHLLLDAVSKAPATAADLAVASRLPRRLIVEAFIRLMRAGWVEVAVTTSGTVFQITPSGAARVDHEQLPAATVTEPRWRGFAIEPITGSVFRGRELELVHRSRVPGGTSELPVVQINNASEHAIGDLSEVFSAIEGEDELIVGVDRGLEKLAERYAIVTVRDGVIEGLPGRASPWLRLLIIKAAEAATKETGRNGLAKSAIDGPTVLASAATQDVEVPQMRGAAFDGSDVIIDGGTRPYIRADCHRRNRTPDHPLDVSQRGEDACRPADADKGCRTRGEGRHPLGTGRHRIDHALVANCSS